ncbi:hypothetical protein CPC16_009646 [Podila verticillata]|nr:hypothetical protein CPC16_009646 [Podila verticillata]
MSGGTLSREPGPPVLNTGSHARNSYQGTVDQARAYASELDHDLASAFDQLNDKTALVLRAYVGSLCQEGHTYSEIESIRDRMKQYFEDRFQCIGVYWQLLPDQDEARSGDGGLDKDEEQGKWIGNPVFDTAFVSMMQELKYQDENAEETRQVKRRTAVGYEDMSRLMEHLQAPEIVESVGVGRTNVYQIYPQADEPHSCCVTKLSQWIEWVQQHENWSLQADDYLFPEHYKDGQIQLDQSFSVTQLSTLLNKYATDAGIMDHRYNRLDTHCFRRGCAQYRFNHAQDPWPLKAIKWWGGWSETEPAEKILEYLFDDSQYEVNFGDMMSPRRRETHRQLGVAKLPVGIVVTRECFQSTLRSMESRHATLLTKIEKEVQGLRRQNSAISQQLENVVHILASRVPDNMASQVSDDQASRISDDHASQVPDDRAFQVPGDQASQAADTLDRSSQPSDQSRYLLPHPSDRPQREQPQHQPLHQSPSEPLQRERTHRHPICKTAPHHQPSPPEESQDQHPQPSSRQHSTETTIPRILEWKEAIKQWDEGDPENGLDIPLSQWTLEMRRNQSAYNDRKLIVKEFESFGRSEVEMRLVYGESMNGVRRLVKAIRIKRKPPKQETEEDEKGVHVPRATDWKDVIQQWERGDPDNGLIPLCKWNRTMQQQSHVYLKRRVIGKEFEFYGRDEARMRQVYGDSMDQIVTLLKAIRDRHKSLEKGESRAIRAHQVHDDETESEAEEEEDDNEMEDDFDVPPAVVPRINSWTQAVQQWEEGDPQHGLTVPIRKWPAEWRESKQMRMLYQVRKDIAEEFVFCGHDKNRMRELYGKDMDQITTLLKSIRRRRREQRTTETSQDENRDQEEEAEEEEGDESLTRKRRRRVTFEIEETQSSSQRNKP